MRGSPLLLLLFPALLLASMNASPSGLHPLSSPLPEARIEFTLRQLVTAGESVMVESRYSAHRERDVRKQRHFHLLGSVFRIGSNDLVTVQRDEFFVARQTVTATAAGIAFAVPLRAPDEEYRAYGLESVRVGRVEFGRWTSDTPILPHGFGLVAERDALTGRFRREGIGALPLSGKLPLWPSLRRVDVAIENVCRPAVELWDPMKKHHWDGWRQTTPQDWPGGRTILARHIAQPTVWRVHEYHAYPPGSAPPILRPEPPVGVLPGVEREAFWPEGSAIEFPEVLFAEPASVLSLPVARLTARARQILADAATLRPGLEHLSVSAAEWGELDALATGNPPAGVEWEIKAAEGDRSILVGHRREFTEAWIHLFGIEYDDDRRYAVAALVLHPQRWTGELPKD